MAWLVERVVKAILAWLESKGLRIKTQIESDRRIDERIREQVEAVKAAKTDEEFDRAARDVFSK
jgi:hypothetical protein